MKYLQLRIEVTNSTKFFLQIIKEMFEVAIRMDFTYTGFKYLNDCPAEPTLPLLLSLGGFLMLFVDLLFKRGVGTIIENTFTVVELVLW
uniref:Uncharacterized protein n=1 Tax=Strigamia maritima TaxID=126957 RepID=T1ILV5_STRMM